ncbi:hypothetical protein B0H21DRAFT_723245 [Amylocystis lapponica]|nr:hypothetical protein B0H21DRAFT_723245 [Amylocystis lapponica]
MPRRPRPASRRPPHHALASKPPSTKTSLSSVSQANRAPSGRIQRVQEVDSDAASSSSSQGNEEDEPQSEGSSSSSSGRHWGESEEDSMSDSNADAEEPSIWCATVSLQDDLASLPFGALRKAQRQLAQASALDHTDGEESSNEDDAEPEPVVSYHDAKGKGKEKEISKPKSEIPKRKHKHAPIEVTSKRPVPRKKLPEGEKTVSRDPRFLDLAGEFSPQKFHSQYGFLSDLHMNEMKTLKDNLKRARKLLASSPRDLREEREQEVQRLERAVKRAESMVNKDRREKIEQEALHKVAKGEREKRKEGKGAWYMKDSDKKQLLLRAKFEALAAAGGKGAVKKAIEKKQKKVGQKEKKQRPFAPGESGGSKGPGWTPKKRPQPGFGDDGQRKRRRVD